MAVQGIVNIQGGFRFVGRVRLDHFEMIAGDPGAMKLARISPERLLAQLEKRAMDRSRSPRGAGAAGPSSAPTAPSRA